MLHKLLSKIALSISVIHNKECKLNIMKITSCTMKGKWRENIIYPTNVSPSIFIKILLFQHVHICTYLCIVLENSHHSLHKYMIQKWFLIILFHHSNANNKQQCPHCLQIYGYLRDHPSRQPSHLQNHFELRPLKILQEWWTVICNSVWDLFFIKTQSYG